MQLLRFSSVAIPVLLAPALTFAQTLNSKPCPLLGLTDPNPSTYAATDSVKAAVRSLQQSITDALSGKSVYGGINSTTTAFAVDVYSIQDNSPLFTYHYTPQSWIAQSTVGVRSVDSNTVFRIGSVSKLYTTYLYLLSVGDSTWNQPVSRFIPEIASYIDKTKANLLQSTIDTVDWSSITIGALASHLAGLPRDAAYSGLLERALQSVGLPPPANRKGSDCGDDARLRIPCNRTAFFQEYLSQHPVVPSFTTPAYGNAPFQILAYALENITGTPSTRLFENNLVQQLGLNSTYYTVPPNTNTSIIPFNNATTSWWNADALDETTAGGYFSSINDMRKIGKSILNSTYLPPAVTRRWMKPHSFTANANYSVGAPWEILRAPGEPVSWMYTKSGNLGAYAAMVALMPEHKVGFSVLAAGSKSVDAVRILSDLTSSAVVPAVQAAAKANTAAVYAGTYIDAATNSSITVAVTDSNQGLTITEWKFGGQQVLPLLGQLMGIDRAMQNLTGQLYYTGLKSGNGTLTSWRAIYQALPQVVDPGSFSLNCVTWGTVNSYTYGGVGLDEFVFTLDGSGSTALSLQPRVLGKAFTNVKGLKVPRSMRRVTW